MMVALDKVYVLSCLYMWTQIFVVKEGMLEGVLFMDDETLERACDHHASFDSLSFFDRNNGCCHREDRHHLPHHHAAVNITCRRNILCCKNAMATAMHQTKNNTTTTRGSDYLNKDGQD